MISAKTELLEALQDNDYTLHDILCSCIRHKKKSIKLKIDGDVEQFFNQLNFKYDNVWCCQELFGTIWLKDNTWFGRREHDGLEWWVHYKLPLIPDDLK